MKSFEARFRKKQERIGPSELARALALIGAIATQLPDSAQAQTTHSETPSTATEAIQKTGKHSVERFSESMLVIVSARDVMLGYTKRLINYPKYNVEGLRDFISKIEQDIAELDQGVTEAMSIALSELSLRSEEYYRSSFKDVQLEDGFVSSIPKQYSDAVTKLKALIISAKERIEIADNAISNDERTSIGRAIFDAVKDKDSYLPTPEETKQIAEYVQMVDEIVKARNKQAALAVSLRSAVLRGATDEVSSLTVSLQQAIEKQDENWKQLSNITKLGDVINDLMHETFKNHAPIILGLYNDGIIAFK